MHYTFTKYTCIYPVKMTKLSLKKIDILLKDTCTDIVHVQFSDDLSQGSYLYCFSQLHFILLYVTAFPHVFWGTLWHISVSISLYTNVHSLLIQSQDSASSALEALAPLLVNIPSHKHQPFILDFFAKLGICENDFHLRVSFA
jgi:hypothetical protein